MKRSTAILSGIAAIVLLGALYILSLGLYMRWASDSYHRHPDLPLMQERSDRMQAIYKPLLAPAYKTRNTAYREWMISYLRRWQGDRSGMGIIFYPLTD